MCLRRCIMFSMIAHTKYMVTHSFMWVAAMFIFHDPMPAFWPKGRTFLSINGPYLSKASWSVLRPSPPASLVLGPLTETKMARLPGRYPASQESTLTRRMKPQVQCNHLQSLFDCQHPRGISQKHRQAARPKP